MANYQGVILAAGHGERMGPFGKLLPKPIVPICNKPLLAYQLEYMRQVGIEEVVIVIGHLGHCITQTLGDGSAYGVHITYVEQERRLGIAHAVGQLEPYIHRPFLLFLGDIFFELGDVQALFNTMNATGATAVLAVREETDPEAVKRNFSVILNEEGLVRRVIEKPRHLINMLKGCGLYLFDLPVFDAIRHTPRTAMRDEYELTDSIQLLIDYGYSVRVSPVVNWDINVTYIGDLIRCSMHVLKKMDQRFLVGADCRYPDDILLEETVLGDQVVITGPVTFSRCVVMPGVTVEPGHYSDCVLTHDGVLKACSAITRKEIAE